MNNVNDQLLLELNKMEKVQLSGQINGKPASTSTLEKIANFSKTSASKIDPLQQKQGGSTPTVRNLGQRVADRDSEWIKTKSRIQSHRSFNNTAEDIRDHPITGVGLNSAIQYVAPIVPSISNAVLIGLARRKNNQYYRADKETNTSKFNENRLKLQDIRHRQRHGELPMVDHKTRMAFRHAHPDALDDAVKKVREAYTQLERRRMPKDFTRHETLSSLVKQGIKDTADSTKGARETVKSATSTVSGVASKIADTAKPATNAVAKSLSNFGSIIKSAAHSTKEYASQQAQKLLNKVAPDGSTARSALQKASQATHAAADVTSTAASNLRSRLGQSARSVKVRLMRKLSPKARRTLDNIPDNVRKGTKSFLKHADKSMGNFINADNDVNHLISNLAAGESWQKTQHAWNSVKKRFARRDDESVRAYIRRLGEYAGTKLPFLGSAIWPFIS